MLKYIRAILRELQPYLLIILLGCVTAALVPHPKHGQTETNYKAPQQYPLETWAAVLAAIFTGWIAGYAVLQYSESRKSSERQLRAYVLIDSSELKRNGTGITLQLKIRNFGETPAYDTIISLYSGWRDRGSVLKEMALGSEPLYKHPASIIAPKHPMMIPIEISNLPADTNYWGNIAKMNTTRPFVWGRIDYVDAFGHPRWTKFQLFSDLDSVMAFGFCAAGNDADHRN